MRTWAIPLLTDRRPRVERLQSFEPPSTRTVSPVIHRASSRGEESHNPADIVWLSKTLERLHAEREGLAPRPSWEDPTCRSSITPGATAFTRMPRGPSAAAKYLTSVSIAPFVAA